MLLSAQSYPSVTTRGDVVETYIASNNAIEIGLANAGNARRGWILSRHATTTSTLGQYYSTFHIQPDIGNKSQYRGLAIGYPANTQSPLHVHLAVNGKVGIGTINPSQMLEVNGTIRAKEIKLEVTNWPDYVFEKGYDLMSLEEVKAHIDQKGHLPGLKPAKEYQAEGVNIMELNQKLLEKIEQLTLHLIRQEEVIKEILQNLDQPKL